MLNDSSVFSFELNESLYFERGQEVSEIINISLDPEISIQSFHEYISIRGVVELKGEYLKVNSTADHGDVLAYNNEHSKRYMEKVIDTEEGHATFTHRFPVEISVPIYRVKDLEDIKVRVASFDYELPDQSQLQLQSTIAIYGIHDLQYGSPEKRSESIETIEENEQIESPPLHVEDHFQFEVKKETEITDETQFTETNRLDQPSEDHQPIPSMKEESADESLVEEDSETVDDSKDAEKGRWPKTKTQSFAEFFNKEKETESEAVSPEAAKATEKDTNTNPQASDASLSQLQSLDVSPSTSEWVDESSRSADQQESSSNTEDKDRSEESEHMTDVQYLSTMFEESEERYSKMKLCIVQEQDTLESIAERYQVTSLQLIHQNQLVDENITKGQLLYIPLSKKNEQI